MVSKINELKIVVIGGGTGTYTILKGIKNYFKNITSIVTMFDSGGSSGILRDEFGYLPPGDIRRAILALIPDDTNETFRQLLSYRFGKGSGLTGHNFGNLLLTALSDISGNEVNAIKNLSNILKLQGTVLPVSTTHSNLVAKLEDGRIIKGETNIDLGKYPHENISNRNAHEFIKIKEVYLEPDAIAFDESVDSILNADLIIIGPGDLYTSIIPNLLTKGISKALCSTKAKKLYICSVMSKYYETHGYNASEYLNEITKYSGCHIDFMIVNSKEINNKELLKKYYDEKAIPVIIDEGNLSLIKTKVIKDDVISETNLIRHDPDKVAKTILKLVIDVF